MAALPARLPARGRRRGYAADAMNELIDEPIDDETFEDWVFEAIEGCPAFRSRLGSVAILIEDKPSRAELDVSASRACTGSTRACRARRSGRTARRRPRGSRSTRSPASGRQAPRAWARVNETVHHEIAHHFGISDDRLRELAREHPATDAATNMDATILLVEDDPSIREVIALGLRGAGFTVTTAADGQEGLATGGPPRRICPARRDAPPPRRPRGLPGDPARGHHAHRDAHRPGGHDRCRRGTGGGRRRLRAQALEMPELVARVRAALRRHREEPGPGEATVLHLGPLRIDRRGAPWSATAPTSP